VCLNDDCKLNHDRDPLEVCAQRVRLSVGWNRKGPGRRGGGLSRLFQGDRPGGFTDETTKKLLKISSFRYGQGDLKLPGSLELAILCK
jgi:hypothetical protein